MDSKQVFAGVFSRHAVAYRDRIAGTVGRRQARGRTTVLDLLAVRPGEPVLDLGCGPGTLTLPLAEAAGPAGLVVGVDLAPGMLALAAAERPRNVVLARMDIEQLGLRAGAFAAVAAGNALQFCPDLGRALGEARRVLRAGGRFAASLPAGPGGRHARPLLEEVFDGLLPPTPDLADWRPTRDVTGDPRRLREVALAAGFERAEVTRVEELIRYAGPRELVDRAMSWWDCAWRLESASAEERARVRSKALSALREHNGDAAITLPGVSHVLYAE